MPSNPKTHAWRKIALHGLFSLSRHIRKAHVDRRLTACAQQYEDSPTRVSFSMPTSLPARLPGTANERDDYSYALVLTIAALSMFLAAASLFFASATIS